MLTKLISIVLLTADSSSIPALFTTISTDPMRFPTSSMHSIGNKKQTKYLSDPGKTCMF